MLESSAIENPFPCPPFLRPQIAIAILATIGVVGISFYTVEKFRTADVQKVKQVPPVPQIKTVTALGRLEPKDQVIKLSVPTAAQQNRLEKLLVNEGDTIHAGQIVAILDSRPRLAAALQQANEQVRVTQAQLQQVKAGAKQGQIKAQQASVAGLTAERETQIEAQQATIARLTAEKETQVEAQKATILELQAQADNAQAEYHRYQTLYQEGAISISQRDSKRLTFATAQQQVAEARANLKRIQQSIGQQLAEAHANLRRIQQSVQQQINQGKATLNQIAEVRPVDIAVAQAQVNNAIAAAKQAGESLQEAYVRSPQDGRVLKIHTRAGELVSSDGIVEIGRTSEMYAVAQVYQNDVNKVRPGQQVLLSSDSLHNELYGTVDWIGWEVQRQDVVNSDPSSNIDARIVEVHVRLDEPSSQKTARFTNLQVKAVINL